MSLTLNLLIEIGQQNRVQSFVSTENRNTCGFYIRIDVAYYTRRVKIEWEHFLSYTFVYFLYKAGIDVVIDADV